MAETNHKWSEPKSDYKATDQVVPNIFNELANNEKYLKEVMCEVIIKKSDNTEVRTNGLIVAQSESSGQKLLYKNADGTLTEIEVIASKSSKDGNGNVISSTYATKSGKENLSNKTYEGYTLNKACEKDFEDSTLASAIGTGEKLTTERDVYYGLPTINNKHDYNSNTKIFTPTNQLASSSEKRFLIGSASVDSMEKENTNEGCYMQNGQIFSNGSKTINVSMFVLEGTTLTITTNQ